MKFKIMQNESQYCSGIIFMWENDKGNQGKLQFHAAIASERLVGTEMFIKKKKQLFVHVLYTL